MRLMKSPQWSMRIPAWVSGFYLPHILSGVQSCRFAAAPVLILVVWRIWQLCCCSSDGKCWAISNNPENKLISNTKMCLPVWKLIGLMNLIPEAYWLDKNQSANPINQNSCHLTSFLLYDNAVVWRIIRFPFTLISLSGFTHNGKQDYFMGFHCTLYIILEMKFLIFYQTGERFSKARPQLCLATN